MDWLDAKARIDAAQQAWGEAATASRVLLINASLRNDGTCHGEMSKTRRLTQLARQELQAKQIEVDLPDLSLSTSEYGLIIHPCKSCVSTAMPLCHWPCSFHSNQT